MDHSHDFTSSPTQSFKGGGQGLASGLRVYDISRPATPREVAYYVPPPPDRLIDFRPNAAKVIQSCDVFVDVNGVMYLTDTNAGLYILQYDGSM